MNSKTIETFESFDDNIKEKISETLGYFDFHRVKITMQALDWWWSSTRGVPSIDKMVECAYELLVDATSGSIRIKGNYTVSTGGFEAEVFWDKDLNRVDGVNLMFVVSQWDCEVEHK